MLSAWLLDRVLLPLRTARSIKKYTHRGDLITVGDLLRVMNQYSDGFTVAPLADKTGVFKTPQSGYCVALPGIACLVDPESESEASTGSQLQEWVSGLAQALLSQCAWIGGYLWHEGEHEGKLEVAVSVVFRRDRLGDAALALDSWKQESLFAINPRHPDGGLEITQREITERS